MELEMSSLQSPMGQHGALVWSPSDTSPNFKTRYSKTFHLKVVHMAVTQLQQRPRTMLKQWWW